LVIADVVITGFEPEFGWKFRISGLQPWDFAAVRLGVCAVFSWKRKERRFVKSVSEACEHSAETAHDPVRPRSAVSIGIVDGGHAIKKLGGAVCDV